MDISLPVETAANIGTAVSTTISSIWPIAKYAVALVVGIFIIETMISILEDVAEEQSYFKNYIVTHGGEAAPLWVNRKTRLLIREHERNKKIIAGGNEISMRT